MVLWTEQYQPRTEADLVVNKKRVADVREFLVAEDARVLILKGPPGAGKAATLHALCNDLGLEVVEWSQVARSGAAKLARPESLTDAFLRFIANADRYPGLAPVGAAARPLIRGGRRIALVRDVPVTLLAAPRERDDSRGTAPDFLARFRILVRQGAVRRAVFCFNDAPEDFLLLQRLLAHVDPAQVRTVHFDGVPRTFAQRALQGILSQEGLSGQLGVQALAISAECGGDLRHAVNALQLAAAGLAREQPPLRSNRKTRGRGATKAVPSAADPAAAPQAGLRGASLGLFHALGRLLYNKRVPPPSDFDAAGGEGVVAPPTKRARKGSSGDLQAPEPKQLPHALLVPKSQRPPLYFVPEEVLSSSGSDPGKVVDWLFTNAPRFYGDASDLAELAGTLALADVLGGGGWVRRMEASGDSVDALRSWDSFHASLGARAVLDANLHPVPPAFGDPCNPAQGAAAASFNMVRPTIRDTDQLHQRRRELLETHLCSLAPQALGGARAGATTIRSTLPHVHAMLMSTRGGHPTLSRLPYALMQAVMELNTFGGSAPRIAGADGAPAHARGAAVDVQPEPAADWSVALKDDPVESFD